MKIYPLVLLILLLAGCGGPDGTIEQGHEHSGDQAATARVEEAVPGGESAEEHTHEREGEPSGHIDESEGEPSAQEEEDAQGHRYLTVPLQKQKAWGIHTGRVHKQSLSARVVLPGVMALNQNRTAHVSAFVHGQISDLSVDLGNRVLRGQPLITLNSPEFAQLQADFLSARAKYNLSRTEYQRARALWEAKAIEEKEYLRRQAEHEKLATEYGALGSQLHSLGLTHDQIEALIQKCSLIEDLEYKCEVADPHLPILSPLSGTVIYRDAVKGAHIEPEKILLTVSDLDVLWALLDVYEKDIPRVTKKSRVTIQTALYSGRAFPARITHISDLIDEKLRTLKIRAEVDNPDGVLKPGMYVQGLLESEVNAGEMVLAVPEEAVQNLEGEKVVFVREAPDVFAVRNVRLGDKVGELRIILAGLTEREDVVLEGAFTLKSEISKGTFGHSHVH